jgi:hypothetical protein
MDAVVDALKSYSDRTALPRFTGDPDDE